MTPEGGDSVNMVDVHLVGLSPAVHTELREHQDDLRREFALIAETSDPQSVPPRLLKLTQDLRERFEEFAEEPAKKIDEAAARGEESVDVVFRVPREAGPAASELAELLAEADLYCLRGEGLLTLAAPGRAAAYREWFLGEFTRQVAGERPVSWPQYLSRISGARRTV